MAQEEGAERGWPWADDARACVRLWRLCDLGRRRQEPPRALWLPPTGMGSRGAQYPSGSGEVGSAISAYHPLDQSPGVSLLRFLVYMERVRG